MSQNVYLDDVRTPPTDREWVVLRTSEEAINFVKTNGCPSYWSFDHDLGGEDTTMVFLKWLIDEDLNKDGAVIPVDFHWDIHSSNPPGRKNIQSLLDSYTIFKKTL